MKKSCEMSGPSKSVKYQFLSSLPGADTLMSCPCFNLKTKKATVAIIHDGLQCLKATWPQNDTTDRGQGSIGMFVIF